MGIGTVGVMCREVGYTSGYASCCNAYGNHYRDSFVRDIRCTGDERKLLDCNHTVLQEKADCKYASAICFNEEKHQFGKNPSLPPANEIAGK